MTVVDTATGEIVERPSYSDVRDSITIAREAGAKFFEQIVWQVERRAWEVLGYADWDAMRDEEYADMGVVVPRADRPEIVTRMRRSGLTQVQIADTLGVNRKTVATDLASMSDSDIDLPPTVTNSRGQERPTSYTKTPEPEAAPDSRPVDPDGGRGEGAVHTPPAPVTVCDRTAPAVETFVDSSSSVQSARWQRNFMDAIAKSGQIILFDPEDIAANAGPELISEYERLIRDLGNHLARVRKGQPVRLTAIKGGAK